MSERDTSELKNSNYEVFIGVLSVLSIVNVALAMAIDEDDVITSVIVLIDGLLSIIFLTDFAYRLLTAANRRHYFFRQFGWADLAASIPLPQAKILRLFRIFRAYRLLRAYGPANMAKDFIENRAQSALLFVLLLIILLLEFGGMGLAWAEKDAEGGNIKTGGDAVWWAYVTITTVGYGDRFPVTAEGRFIGVLVLTAGVGLFGVLTGFVANFFLSPRRPARLRGSVPPSPKTMLADIREALEKQDQENERLRERLREVERLL